MSSTPPAPAPDASDAPDAPAVPADPGAPVVHGTVDTRTGGPMLGGEREQLDAWIAEYRLALLLKIDGLTPAQLAERSAPPSALSLAGIVRHLAEVEEYWLREVLHGIDVPPRWSSAERPDDDLEGATAATAADDVQTYLRVIAETSADAARWEDLDIPVTGLRHGQPLNLRWILTHLIEEYARHLGHMDLLRERIDGATGY
ncbi:DinB family protein [Brachybacterium sp. DNPG3]